MKSLGSRNLYIQETCLPLVAFVLLSISMDISFPFQTQSLIPRIGKDMLQH